MGIWTSFLALKLVKNHLVWSTDAFFCVSRFVGCLLLVDALLLLHCRALLVGNVSKNLLALLVNGCAANLYRIDQFFYRWG